MSYKFPGGVPDPFLLYDSHVSFLTHGWRQAAGLQPRTSAIDPTKKTLVLLVCGQSLMTNICPTLYLPSNPTKIDQLSVYDGQLYEINGPVLGTSYVPALTLNGPGCVAVDLCDRLIARGWDRVILCDVAIGSTSISWWGDDGGIHESRGPVVMARLARRGIVPGMTGLYFGCAMQIGNDDFSAGTSTAAFAASAQLFMTKMRATGFVGRFFFSLESAHGQTSNAIRTAQASLWNNVDCFSFGDFDSTSITMVDGVHPDDAGRATMAAIADAAMAASGNPF